MKKLTTLLMWFGLFIIWDISTEYIKNCIENGILSKWFFIAFCFAVLVVSCVCVLLRVKKLKESKQATIVKNLIYFMLFWAMYISTDATEYLFTNNMLNKYYLLGIESLFVFIGWGAGRLDNILTKQKKKK